jgi:3'-phosphoadenosine 5'-phosphosulfate sulfotransferase (PAPS reductase)/FAD synthetase
MTAADFKRPKLELPDGADKLLLHSCCAPCSGEVMEAIQVSTTSERQGRVIDRDQAGSMELKKRQGYF